MRSTVSPPAVLRLARAPLPLWGVEPCAAEPEPFVVCVMPFPLVDISSVCAVCCSLGKLPGWWPSAADAFPSVRRRRRLGLRRLGGQVARLDPGGDVLGAQQGDRGLEVLEG